MSLPIKGSQCFQVFLELVAQQFLDSILIIQLDNARCHKAKNLQIPSSQHYFIVPTSLLPRTRFGAQVAKHLSVRPESNPIEQVWQYLKRGLRWFLPASLVVPLAAFQKPRYGGRLHSADELRYLIAQRLEVLDEEVIASITARTHILEALSVVQF